MVYTIAIAPYSVKKIENCLCQYQEYPKYKLFSIDKESYIVNATIENSDEGQIPVGRLVYNLQIGRYCSIAKDLYILVGRGKNYHNVTMSAAKVFELLHKGYNDHGEHGSVIIQNDVWIGSKVTIMGGVIIHNGAVVAANSHVVKDVPPYAIVGGNPAKVIGYRFEKNIIQQLQKIQWWYWNEEKIKKYAEDFGEVEKFCKQFYLEADEQINKIKDLGCSDDKDRYLMLVDDDDNYSTLSYVIDEFLACFKKDKNKELLLTVLNKEPQTDDMVMENIKKIQHIMEENNAFECTLSVEKVSFEEVKNYIPFIKHLIINRKTETVQLMCWAEVYGDNVEIISGVDTPIFGGY